MQHVGTIEQAAKLPPTRQAVERTPVVERRKILIVHHPDDRYTGTHYVIHALANVWRDRGLTVETTCDVADQQVGDDTVVIPHLDATHTPAEYQRFFDRCPVVLNRRVTDISKRHVSRHLVTSPDAYDGPVIVKTDLNAGGAPENDKVLDRGPVASFLRRAKRKFVPWWLTGMIKTQDYHVYDHPRLVPGPVWRNRGLVVERFMPERRDGQYCLRQYVFLGDHGVNSMAFANVPVVKASNVTHRVLLSEPAPAELVAQRREMGFDYGKFDYVLFDGQAVLLDANRTTTYNVASKAGAPSEILAELARGIDAFLTIAASNR
jgi:hypothetical protein